MLAQSHDGHNPWAERSWSPEYCVSVKLRLGLAGLWTSFLKTKHWLWNSGYFDFARRSWSLLKSTLDYYFARTSWGWFCKLCALHRGLICRLTGHVYNSSAREGVLHLMQKVSCICIVRMGSNKIFCWAWLSHWLEVSFTHILGLALWPTLEQLAVCAHAEQQGDHHQVGVVGGPAGGTIGG